MSKIFNLKEVREKFGGYVMAFDDLPGTGYKALILAHCENTGLTWYITAANVYSKLNSPDFWNASEETHIIQYKISNNSMSAYVDGVSRGVIFEEDIPELDSCRDGEGYYNVDNIVAPDFWNESLKRLLSQYVNAYYRAYYNISHEKHTL